MSETKQYEFKSVEIAPGITVAEPVYLLQKLYGVKMGPDGDERVAAEFEAMQEVAGFLEGLEVF